MSTLALQQDPPPRFYQTTLRIAASFETRIINAYLRALRNTQATVDLVELEAALLGGNLSFIEIAAGATRFGPLLAAEGDLFASLFGTSATTGEAATIILAEESGIALVFDATFPDSILFARSQTATLIRAIDDAARETVRIVVAAGQARGITVVDQARILREVIGVPPNWADASLRLGENIRNGQTSLAVNRRLSAIDKARIRKAIKDGTVTEEFIAEMQGNYSKSLTNRRALNIAGTESRRAAHEGQRQAWRQGVRDGALPADVKRVALVTNDDRLRETHAAIPGLNSEGVGLNEPFQTPFGPRMNPPFEILCRCGTGLLFSGVVL